MTGFGTVNEQNRPFIYCCDMASCPVQIESSNKRKMYCNVCSECNAMRGKKKEMNWLACNKIQNTNYKLTCTVNSIGHNKRNELFYVWKHLLISVSISTQNKLPTQQFFFAAAAQMNNMNDRSYNHLFETQGSTTIGQGERENLKLC